MPATSDELDMTPQQSGETARHSSSSCRDMIKDLLDKPESGIAAQIIHYFIIFVIILSTAAVILETVPEFHSNPLFFPLETCITALFTIEFVLRFYICDSIRTFTTNCFNIIDFLAIFPGYIELLILMLHTSENSGDHRPHLAHVHKAASSMRTLRMIRIVRLVRVFRVMRLAKVARHSQLMSIILAVFVKVSQSGFVVVIILMAFAMVLSASLIYLFESELCESTGYHCVGTSAFVSIPASFWWAISTLTTVGYGDMVPHTVAGKIVGGATSIAGVIVVAIGVGLVSMNFRECFIEEKARADSKRRGGPALAETKQEQDEIEALLENFDQCSMQLLTKLRGIALHQDDGTQLMAMLDMINSHTNVLKSDVKTFTRIIAHE